MKFKLPHACDVGRPLVGLQGSNNEKGDPQGASLHHIRVSLLLCYYLKNQ